MTLIDAFILGIIEGLTEFVPVSSTAHMALASHGMGLKGDLVNSFEIAIQSGAILAVVIIFHRRFARFLDFKATNKVGLNGRNGIFLIAASTIPVLTLAFFFKNIIKGVLFAPAPMAVALAVGGIAMIAVERWVPHKETTNLEKLDFAFAVKVGIIQCLALWPGISRAASTIVGSRLLGLSRAQAAEYSFLLAVPALLAATGYELLSNPALISEAGSIFVTGLVTAFVTAWIAIKGFLFLLQRWTLAPYGWYRLALAGLVALALK